MRLVRLTAGPITVKSNRAVVERDDDFERRFAFRRRLLPKRRQRLFGRGERVPGGALGIGGNGHRKDGEQPVADKFQDLAAMARDRLRLQIEQLVEDGDDSLRRQMIGQMGETAEIRRPEHGGDGLAAAAPDLTRQHPRPGLRPEIGGEDVFGDLPLTVHVGDDRQMLRQGQKVRRLAFGEPAGAVRDIGRHVPPGTERARDRQRKILGSAAGLQLAQDGKVELRFGAVQPAAQDLASLAHPPDRVVVVGERITQFMRDHDLLGLPGVAPPQICGATKLRMQRSAVQTDAKYGKAGGQQSPGELVEHLQEGIGPPCVRRQPVRDPLDRVVRRPFRRGPLENGCRDDGLAVDDEGLRFAFGQALAPDECRAAGK
jgi:hypothetical protein